MLLMHSFSVKALIGHQIVSQKSKMGGNKMMAEVLTMTTKTKDRDVVKTFQYLYKILLAKGIVFDPLKIFGDAENANPM